MGSGDSDGTNACFTVSAALTAVIAVLGLAVVLCFAGPISTLLGAGEPGLHNPVFRLTKDYLIGFMLGVPAFLAAQIMVPYMQMSGCRKRLVAAVLLMTVSDVVFDFLNVLVFHGGIHQLTYYGQMMAMKTPHIRRIPAGHPGQNDPPDIRWTVCGSLCTTSDILVRDCPLGNLSPGDRLVFARAGAYSVTEGISLFLCRDLPSVYLSEAGKLRLVRPGRGTEEIVCP